MRPRSTQANPLTHPATSASNSRMPAGRWQRGWRQRAGRRTPWRWPCTLGQPCACDQRAKPKWFRVKAVQLKSRACTRWVMLGWEAAGRGEVVLWEPWFVRWTPLTDTAAPLLLLASRIRLNAWETPIAAER